MNLRFNKILVGIIILLIGIGSLFRRYVNFDYSALMLSFSGLGFLLLYRTKRKTWSLIIGSYVGYLGAMGFATGLGLGSFIPSSAAAMFFLIPGIIFLILYYDKNKRGLLLPGMLFIWMGMYVFISNSGIFNMFYLNSSALFFICAGMGCLCAYLIGRDFLPKMLFYLGFCIIITGLFLLVNSLMKDLYGSGISDSLFFLEKISWLPSYSLIAIAVIIIVSQIKKK